MASRKKPYNEGCWIAVPLAERGGYGLGVIARCKSGICLGYFFEPRHSQVPKLEATQGLAPQQAVLIARFGDMGLLKGEWTILGHLDDWDRARWPVPTLQEQWSGGFRLVEYSGDDPTLNGISRQYPTTAQEANKHFSNALAGHAALSSGLDRALYEREHGITRLQAFHSAPVAAKSAR
ncbi:MAG: Imm26 family immunity protein [Polyangia bacterium]